MITFSVKVVDNGNSSYKTDSVLLMLIDDNGMVHVSERDVPQSKGDNGQMDFGFRGEGVT